MAASLEFVPYTHKHAVSIGEGYKRVVLRPRSPSPPALGMSTLSASRSQPVSPAKVRRIAPTRVEPVASSSAVSAGSSEEAPSPSPPPPPPAPVSAPSTPSRKGKERQVVESGAVENGVNGHMNGSVKGTLNGVKSTPNGTPRATEASASTLKSKAGVDLAWPAQFATARRAAGLRNGSMACYTNASLQILLHTPPVLRAALEHRAADCLLIERKKFCMLCALRTLAVEDHWTGKRVYNPLAVHKHLGQIKKGFSRNRQEDTHEFFRFVTDALQNTALAGRPKDLPEKLKRQTWVYRTWGGQVRSRVLCLSCRKPSDTFDSFLDLSLDVPPRARTVDELLKGFTHEDRLDGENKYNCENCKKKSAATKAMRIAEVPPVLTLHLKRFGYSLSWPSRMTKMNNLIEYPSLLDLAPYMIEGSNEETRYRLFGVTCHHGSSLHYGHYTSYVRGPDGTWFNADDDDVSPVQSKTALHDRSAYLLSYMRISTGDRASGPSAPSTPVAGKRPRDDPPSPSPSPKRPSLKASPASPKRSLSGLTGLANYDSDDDGVRRSAPASPVARRSVPNSPVSKRTPNGHGHGHGKSKHHRLNHKAAALGKKKGAPMPFVTGQMGGGWRSKKGLSKRMRGRHG